MAIKIGGTTVIDNNLSLTNISNLTTSGNVEFLGTGAITLPSGTTAQQPSNLSAGQLRFNTERNKPEIYDGTKFATFSDGGGGGVADYIVADSSLPTYIVKQFEIVENNFTPSDTWQLEANEDDSAILMVVEAPSIDETGEYFEETTIVNTHHVFFETLTIFAESVITVASGKIMQGIAGIGTQGVPSAAVAVDKMQSIGKIYYLNSI